MKNLKQFFTALLLLCCTIATAEEVTIDGIKYDVIIKAKQATVIAGDTEYSGDIIIPSEITHNDVIYKVTTIGEYAFSGCSGLESIEIPNSVTSIGMWAFSGCYGLTSIEIPNSVTSIGWAAFSNCTGLASVEIPNSVTSIEGCAFLHCFELTSITIPNSVTSIGSSAFQNCSGLTSITIPNSVTTIGESAFYDCSGLTSITIPNSVTSIGDEAFKNCSGLTSITIPNSVTSIGVYAFSGCSELTSITIPNSVTSIGGCAFEKCSGLTSITIPNSVTSIGYAAFYNCSGLTSVTIPSSVTSIGESAFSGCSELTSITIPNSVTTIGESAFYNCSGLTSITIPNSVTRIGKNAFQNCSGLTSVTIGSGVKDIYEYAFASCENLTDVYCLATTAPTGTVWSGDIITITNQFENSYPESMTLHVPAEAVESYRATAPWSSFGTIVTLDGEEVETPKCATPVIAYENGKLKISCDTEGAEFVTTITDSDIATHYDVEIELTATYNITTYATLAGYENSEVATATLCWVEKEPVPTDITKIESTAVLITTRNGDIVLKGVEAGTNVAVYDVNGISVGNAVAESDAVVVSTSLEKGAVAIVKIGGKAVKVTMN